MKDFIRFQIQVTTGRFTLPVVILVYLLGWGITFQGWKELISLVLTAAVGYVMIEANTAFTLIRTRTTLPVCIYGLIATSMFFLHPFEWENIVPLTFVLAVYQLFCSYESPTPTNPIYHAFLFISLGSLVFPPFMVFALLFWASMIPFRAMNVKSFLASLIGLATPYWFLFGYAFWFDRMPLFLAPWKEMLHLYPISYGLLLPTEIISWAVIILWLLISSIHYIYTNFKDRTRSRVYHSFLIYAGGMTTLLSVLQPVHLHIWIPIQLICMSFLCGRLFSLTRNLFSGIFFVVTFIMLISLTTYNLWMQFFNF